MAVYHGPAQRLHPALLDSDCWSRPPYTLPTCDVNNSIHSASSLNVPSFIPVTKPINLPSRFAVFGLLMIIISWCTASIYIAVAMVNLFAKAAYSSILESLISVV